MYHKKTQQSAEANSMDHQHAGICQSPDSHRDTVSPSLADKAPAVLRQYFENAQSTFLTQHHIQSYEACLFREIPEILAAENPIVVLKEPLDAEKGIYKYKTEIFVGGEGAAQDLMLDMGTPIVTLDGGKTVRRMFPQEARMRNLTYALEMRADVMIRLTFTNMVDGKYVSTTETIRRDNLPLLKIPILLRSRACATHGADTEMLREMGECPNDQGGYFIIDGSEKVLITRQEQALNSVFVAKKPATDLEVATYATVVCQHPTSKRTNRVALYRLHGKRSVEADVIRVSIPFVKGAIPLFVLFRALGVESDEAIVRMIVPLPNRAAEDSLIPCIHDAWPVVTQIHAIEYIRTLTKGFIVASVLNILHEHLFSHVPDRPLAKAQYLAEIVRKMMRVEAGQEPSTNRDDIRNQRLLPTGVLLRGLFSECWKDWKKTVIRQVDIQYNYNRSSYQDKNFLELFVPGNMPTLMNTQELNDGIMRGFRGRWGTNSFNMKSGVIQPLARISYLDAASHTRRVISDFDTSLKLTGPRQLHPSQVGYFCTSETPTGAHIGATKNMSILTAISVAADPTPLMEWLFSRGGVVEIAAAPRALAATATVVQVNGGTVGFTDKPDILTKVLKLMKWTGCLYPHASISFNTTEGALRIYMDDGRPLRPLWHLAAGGAWPPQATAPTLASWRDLVLGTFAGTRGLDLTSVAFVDPLANEDFPTLTDYEAVLLPHIGAIEYVDPYEGNEAYVSWWGAQRDLTKDHTHAEIHPSTLMGVLASMIPFANHNQSPRNQLSCSQSKQAIGYYATNYENRFDTYGSMLCYGEGALCRTLVHDAVAGGAMPYGTNIIFAFNSFNGYNQDDGIIFNRSSIERGLFRSLALRSYETVEEEDRISKAVYRVGNPKHVLAWTDVRAGYDYTALDDSGVIREGAVIHDKTVLVGRYMMVPETGKVIDASLLPTVFTKGRVDKVVVLHQANGLRLIKVRILEERVPELGDKFCLDDSHDVLTLGRGWVPIQNVTMDDKIAQLNRETQQMEYVHPLEVLSFDHEGEMYEVETQGVSQCVTLNHRMWVQKRNETSFGFVEAKDILGTDVTYMTDVGPVEVTSNTKTVERVIAFSGKVYCLRVPSEVFLVRRAGRCSYTGNSSRHGQKGTMGILLDAQDMPRTRDGIVPDVMVNPHCIPSRMTMAQMLEQLFGKMGSLAGAKMNATPFMNDKQSMEAVGNALESFGFQRMGEEIMYAGTSGVMFSSSVFIGPLNFMRLKHLAQDKINARSSGRKEMRTHQPTGGRGNEGGMRIGEMERDVLIAHGITDFLQESMTKRSDGTSFWICNGCGTIPIVNEAEGLFVCAQCDGPLQYQGVNAETIGLIMPVKKSRCTFSRVAMPYALKLLDQELTTFMNAGFRFLTSRNARGFQEPMPYKKGAEGAEESEETNTGGLTAEELKARLEAFKEMEAAAEEERERKEAAAAKEREEAALRAWAEAEGVEDVASYDVEGLRTLKAKKEEAEKVGPDAPEDREDEGQPARNESGEIVAPPPGEESVDFNAKTAGFKEFDNYFPAKMTLDGKEWPTVEHYFQAAKFPSDPAYQEKIRLTKLPAGAKKLGKTENVAMIPDWPRVREEVMLKAVRAKFQQNSTLAELLLGTGSKLIRNMAKQDNFWGVGRSGKGQNKLGKTLMTVRDELRSAAAGAPTAVDVAVPAVAAAVPAALDLPPLDPTMASFGDEDPLMGIPRFQAPSEPVAVAVAAAPAAAPLETDIPSGPTLTVEDFPIEIEVAENSNEKPIQLATDVAAIGRKEEQEGEHVGKPKITWKGSENWGPTDSIKIIKV